MGVEDDMVDSLFKLQTPQSYAKFGNWMLGFGIYLEFGACDLLFSNKIGNKPSLNFLFFST